MRPHQYLGHFGLKRLEPSWAEQSHATRELGYAAVGTNIDMTTVQDAIATAVSPKILSKPQKRAIIAWTTLCNILASQNLAGNSYRQEYHGHDGLRKLDPSLSFLTDAEVELVYAQATVANDALYAFIRTAVSPFYPSKGQMRALIAWWVLHNINGA